MFFRRFGTPVLSGISKGICCIYMYLNHPLFSRLWHTTNFPEKLAKFQMHLVLAYIFTHDIWVWLNVFPQNWMNWYHTWPIQWCPLTFKVVEGGILITGTLFLSIIDQHQIGCQVVSKINQVDWNYCTDLMLVITMIFICMNIHSCCNHNNVTIR